MRSRSLIAFRPLALASALAVTGGGVSCIEPPAIKTDYPDPPALRAGDLEFSMPEIVIEPGQDVTWCYVPDFTVDEDFVVKRALAYQGASGHHMVIYRSGVPRRPGELFDCTNLETMVSMLPLVIPDVPDHDARTLPEGFGVRVPAGATIVLQSHLINANVEPIAIKDVMQLHVAAAGEELTEASYWVISDNELVLPEGPSTVTKSCTIAAETKLVFQLGHMHEWGKSLSVTRHRGASADVIYEVPAWTAEFRDQGPTTSYPAEAPLVLAPGDRVDLTCSWNNDTGAEIRWPKEMCVTLGAYYPARGTGFIDCDEAIGE
jgi:hypothetical protein